MRTVDVQKILEDHGWRVIRETGSHKMLKKGQAKVPFAYHEREIGPTQIRKLARKFGVEFGAFFKPIDLKPIKIKGDNGSAQVAVAPAPTLKEGAVQSGANLVYLPVSTLQVDRRYQRPLNQPWARELAAKWDDRLLGIMTVSYRDGGYWLLEGQHRSTALVSRGEGERKVPCIVFSNLTLKEEADIYLGRNNVKLSTSMALFRAKLAAGEPAAVDIDRIVREVHGLSIGQGNKAGVQGVGTLFRLHEWGVLAETMDLWSQIWGDKTVRERSESLHTMVLLAIGAAIRYYKDELDRKRFVHVIRPYSALELRHMVVARFAGRGAKGIIASYVVMVDVMRLIYNHRMKGNALSYPDLTAREIADWAK